MRGHFCLVLHAHLPFVRHPEHERFLEESWFYEALLETYLPLLRVLGGWWRDRVPARLTLSLSPTLCAMFADPLLQDRFERHLRRLIELAERESFRTLLESQFQELAHFYHQRFTDCLSLYKTWNGRLIDAFKEYHQRGLIELITCSATHAVLPLLSQAAAVRAQVQVARDSFQEWFQLCPEGFWLPECAYQAGLEMPLCDAGFRWVILETHGLAGAKPAPRWGVYAPLATAQGLAVFGRDPASARQVWSRNEGYPGDFRYRDFYRDIGFDLDLDYLESCLPSPGTRGFTGIKYHRITGLGGDKQPYHRASALEAVAEHARHFLETRIRQLADLGQVMDSPPVLVAPFDAELFGHWWYEGIEFLDQLFRLAAQQQDFQWMTPTDVLARHETLPVAQPIDSSWGEGGYWGVWLNEATHWIYPHLHAAQQQISQLSQQFCQTQGTLRRALVLAGNELLLAQSSDWPFILRTGGSPEYARQRVVAHLERFQALSASLELGSIDESVLRQWEGSDLVFPGLNPGYWRLPGALGQVLWIVLFVIFSAGNIFSTDAPSPPAAGKLGYHPSRILVKTSPNLALRGAQSLHAAHQTRVVRELPDSGGWQVVELPPGASITNYLARFRQAPGVECAEPDYRVRASAEPDDPDYQRRAQWGLHNTNDVDIDAPEGWEVLHDASSIIVAVIDSGIRATHEDLSANLWTNPGEIPGNGIDDDGNGYIDDLHGINAIDNSGNPADDYGHGTHVSGIIGGVGNNGRGITGVAWKVQLMSCKFLGQRGEGYISDAITCMDYARRQGAHILNLSWSDAEFSLALQSAMTRARNAGILIVAAAGNQKSDNDATPNYPSCFDLDNLVSVASVNRAGELARISNYGLKQVDLAAPGDSIYSTYYSWDNDYASTGGTSMAAAYVSGILALLKAGHPSENSQQLISRLLAAAKPLDSLKGRCRSGAMASLGRALAMPATLDFSSSPLTGAIPLRVSFTNTSPGLFTRLRWDFGDGSPLEETGHPVHVYEREGRFQAALHGTDANGVDHLRTRTVAVLANYQVVPSTSSWIEAESEFLSLSNDGVSPGIQLPFLFSFYGRDYDTLYIGANGSLGFYGKGLSSPAPVLPHGGALGPVLCPYGTDLDPSLRGAVSWGITGSSPQRRLVVSWEGVPYFNRPETSVSFQVILSEDTGEIVFQYRQVPADWIHDPPPVPVIGVGDPSGQVAAAFSRDDTIAALTNGLALRFIPASLGGLRVSPLGTVHVPVRPPVSKLTRTCQLSNTSRLPLAWQVEHSQDWLSLSATNGVLDPGQSVPLTLVINSETSLLKTGLYQDYLRFRNLGNGLGNTTRSVALWIRQSESARLQIESVNGAIALRLRGEPRLLCRLEESTGLRQWLPLITNRLSSSGEWLFPALSPASSSDHFYRVAEIWELPDVDGIGGEDGFE